MFILFLFLLVIYPKVKELNPPLKTFAFIFIYLFDFI